MATPQNFITEDTTIKGSITTASSLTVAGAVEGDINAGGEVEVLADAVVKGDMSGPNLRILGRVEGRINASGRLFIGQNGTVVGDISVRSLLIEEGGTLDGQCSMGSGVAAKTAAPKPSPSASSSSSNASLRTPGGNGLGGATKPPSAPPLRPVDQS